MPASTADPDSELLSKYRDADGTLGERLAAFAAAHRRRYPAYADAVDQLVLRLTEGGGWTSAPNVGEEMPPFLLPDANGRLVSLAELCAAGPVALMFHRGHWCPFCELNLAVVSQESGTIEAAGGRVVVIQPAMQRYAARLLAAAHSRFAMLTDIDNGYALALNLAIWVGPDIVQMYKDWNIHLPRYHGNDAWMVPIPATFVLGRDGRIVARFIDPDFRKRMELDDLIAAFKSAT